jgi:transcription antitermination factor NusG
VTLTADPASVTQVRGARPAPDEKLAPTHAAWFAVRVRSRFDFRVAAALADAGIETFFPTQTTETRWSDRSKFVTRPIFAGYIFIRTAPDALHAVRRIAGVVQVLGYRATEAVIICDREIESLRIAVASREPLAECPHVAGERVRVQTGPLAGCEGIISRTKGATRLVMTVEILRRSVAVELDSNDVATVPHKPENGPQTDHR